ncbi:MAG TPA: hypothetical protein VL128_11675 [Candidatus Eisenbacteria bacterium]|nr:hypothetical protein [Candidatus Eisenbacteria bacterium]
MRLPTRLRSVLILATFFLALAAELPAQAPLEPAQLPAGTVFYFLWHGTPTGDVRKTNALLSLWDDSDFAPVRAALVNMMLSDAKSKSDKAGPTREELMEYASLLDNPFTIGYLPLRDLPASASAPAPAAMKRPDRNGMFLVYDRSGKEELLSKAILRARAGGTEIPKLTEVTVAGVKALKIERKSSTTYWAETGKYAVSASDPLVFEDVLTRLRGKVTGPTLAASESYREAKSLLSGGVVEFFLSVPQLKAMTSNSEPESPQVKAFWSTFRLDSMHVFAGHISLEGARTRLQGGVLGDTAEGSLFDIWAEGQSQPDSLALLTPDTVYYNESQLSLLGIYNTLKRAFSQPGSKTAPLALTLESAAETRLGMPLPDALALTSGEFGSLQTSTSLDPNKKVVFAGIRNKPEALKLMRTIFGDQLTSEHNEGNITYMKISLKGSQGSKGVAQWNFYHLAMTPNLLLGANRSDTLRTTVVQASAGANSLPQTLQAARGQFPRKLNGFSYFDLQKLDWPALKDQWVADAVKTAAESKSADAGQKSRQLNDWIQSVNPAVFPRHLHSMTGASWKDATGVHFDEWLD